MLEKQIHKILSPLLPAYLSGTLSPLGQRIVQVWLNASAAARQELANLRTLRVVLREQPRPAPSLAVFQRVQNQISKSANQQAGKWANRQPAQSPNQPSWGIWAWGMVLIMIALPILWRVLPPGILLEWSIQGETPAAFRVYRAPAGLADDVTETRFTLLRELSADSRTIYSFMDFRLLPGRDYVYRVEVLDKSGQPAASQTITSNSLDALPGQIGVLLIILEAGYGLVTLAQTWFPVGVNRRQAMA